MNRSPRWTNANNFRRRPSDARRQEKCGALFPADTVACIYICGPTLSYSFPGYVSKCGKMVADIAYGAFWRFRECRS